MGQQKPVQHHIHVVLWDTKRKTKKKRSVILGGNVIIQQATLKYILYV